MATSALSWSVAANDGAGGRRRSGASVSIEVRASAVLISYGSWERQMPISRTCKAGGGVQGQRERQLLSDRLASSRATSATQLALKGTHVDKEAAQ